MASLFDTLVIDTKKIITNTISDVKPDKNEPSFFDSLLKDSLDSKQIEEKIINEKIGNTDTVIEKNLDSDLLDVDAEFDENMDTLSILPEDSKEDIDNINSEQKIKNKSFLNVSLLDKLVLDSKINENVNQINSQKISNDSLSSINLENQSKIEKNSLIFKNISEDDNLILPNKFTSLDNDIKIDNPILSASVNVEDLENVNSDKKDNLVISLENLVVNDDKDKLDNLLKIDNETKSLMDRLVDKLKNSVKEPVVVDDGLNKDLITVSNQINVLTTDLIDVASNNSTQIKNISNDNKLINLDNKIDKNVLENKVILNNKNINFSEIDFKELNTQLTDENSLINELEVFPQTDEKNFLFPPVLTKSDGLIAEKSIVNGENINTSNSDNINIDNTKKIMNNFVDNQLEIIEEKNIDLEENVIKKVELVETFTKNELPLNVKEVITNIYLSSQKNNLNNQILSVKNEAVTILKDADSIEDLEISASLLDLGLENIEVDKVEKNIENKQNEFLTQDKKISLDRLAFNKNIVTEDLKHLVTTSIEASKALIEDTITKADDLTLNLSTPLSQNISSKIFEARQSLSSMMSDIAKHMYENYKPPITVFRINLNPGQMGSIAIMMKSEKDSAISISMSVSSDSTLQVLSDNQNILRNSLSKNFDDSTKFNLDFTSSNNNQNNSSFSGNQNQSNQNRFMDRVDTKTVLEGRGNNLESEDKNLDYM